jgi:hypothetical protein
LFDEGQVAGKGMGMPFLQGGEWQSHSQVAGKGKGIKTLQMPGLDQSLQSHDLGYLRIVAEFWGLELGASDRRAAVENLSSVMLNQQTADELVETLPAVAQQGLEELLAHNGRIPWPRFAKKFGEVREMGPGRRDRERPYLQPVSPTEMLWYRGLIARAFFEGPDGPEEYAYIPDDLLPFLPLSHRIKINAIGRRASTKEHAHPILAHDRILDDACTMLAALRMDRTIHSIAPLAFYKDLGTSPATLYPLSPEFVLSLLKAGSLLDSDGLPEPEPTRAFLEASRGEALAKIAQAWLESTSLNELHLIPGLKCEGEWENDAWQTRRRLLNLLSGVPGHTWWSLGSFVGEVRDHYPDFQRPAGDYDSWFIRDEQSGEYLRGFEHWDDVDGALIRYMVTGPLHWLGFLDLAAADEGEKVAAFRFSGWSAALLRGSPPEGLQVEEERMTVRSDARLHVPRLVPRAARYQIARFAVWEGFENDVYRYRMTPASLEIARDQGLRVKHLQALLHRHAYAIPPSLTKALERWEDKGTEARLEHVLVLRLRSPEILSELRSSRAARFLGDPLGPTVISIKPGAWEKVLSILAEMGYLAEAKIDDENVVK